jgi:quinol monooxygenase YgiN
MLRLGDTEDEPSEFILVENWADEFMGRVGN